ncbi:type IV secretory system conjugative DNA transfer family protein [Burkholderia vietnamiensis]|uniref:type IV secretory system conjugative DNA transfer family protein n=1 Tax=Burkholderia vietnamiensis TaxID=60552 RepID=UPI00158D2D16|nr:type IV secretory system conjugative DNA transfer family protein [Burkholderia vietnamiensis]
MRNTDGKIAIIRQGENDLNAQIGNVFNKNIKQKETYYLPDQILELSFIIRGEAGGGKTVFIDRLMKETIDAGHSVILHNIKGEELTKIAGYCSFYHIEPWTAYTWEIDFLNLCADKDQQAEDTKIRTLAESFSKVPEEFFDKAGISVVEALIRSVVKSNKDENGTVKATLKDIVNTWHSFNVDETEVMIDTTDIAKVKKAIQQESKQLRMINDFLKKWFPTSSMYIDPKNEKTSLCVLASVVEIVRKFESLSKFWNENAIDPKTKEKRVFDIKKWVHTKKDRKVIVISNSNQFGDVANSYISAFINLTTTQLIDSNYKPVKEVHFILDEFAQLSSVNLNQFLKLPDVGRGLKVRTKIAIQRTSQIKNTWKDFDDRSFASAFQNKIWARFADDDKDNVKHELGKQKLTVYKSSVNWSAQGKSSSSQTETKMEDVANIDDLQKELGPVKMNVDGQLKTVGVSILCNFSNCKKIAVIKFPFVNFTKTKEEYKIKSSAGSGSINTSSDEEKKDKEELAKEILQNVKNSMELVPNQPTIDQIKGTETEEKSLGESVVSDVVAEVLDHTGALSVALKAGEILEGMENFTQNTNVVNSNSELTEDEIELMIREAKNNKNKEKTR